MYAAILVRVIRIVQQAALVVPLTVDAVVVFHQHVVLHVLVLDNVVAVATNVEMASVAKIYQSAQMHV